MEFTAEQIGNFSTLERLVYELIQSGGGGVNSSGGGGDVTNPYFETIASNALGINNNVQELIQKATSSNSNETGFLNLLQDLKLLAEISNVHSDTFTAIINTVFNQLTESNSGNNASVFKDFNGDPLLPQILSRLNFKKHLNNIVSGVSSIGCAGFCKIELFNKSGPLANKLSFDFGTHAFTIDAPTSIILFDSDINVTLPLVIENFSHNNWFAIRYAMDAAS